MGKMSEKNRNYVIVLLLIALIAAVSVLLHVLFSGTISALTVEILAAALAAVLVVASVGVTIHFQSQSETESQYRVTLFEKKLVMYSNLLNCIVKIDDDGRIDPEEIESVRNHSQAVALVGSNELVRKLAAFVEGLTDDRPSVSTDERRMEDNFPSVVQAMREDLAVVQGDVIDHLKPLTRHRRLIESSG